MKKLSIAKKTFLYLILILSFVFTGSFATITSNYANAYTDYYGTNTVTVTNGNFTLYNSSSNNLPFTPSSGWNKIASMENEVYSGIIDTDSTVFSKNDSFTLQSNPGTSKNLINADTKILMIKAKNNSVKFGYQSSDISLSKNKFYEVDIRVKTGLLDKDNNLIEETDAIASIYTNLSSSTELSHINTSGQWQTYKIFIATDMFNSYTLNLQLRLGSKNSSSTGVVFFDNITVIEIANLDYFNEESSYSTNEQFINLTRTEVSGFTNSDFENNLDGFTVIEGTGNASVQALSSISSTIEENNGANSNTYNNAKALFINNRTETKTTIKSNDDNTILIKQHGYYYLTALVKTSSLSSGGLSITLDEKVSLGDSITATQSDLTSSGSTKEYNGFKLVSFYIRGNVRKAVNIGITFTLGTSDSSVSGWAIIDNIKLYEISETEYTNNSSDSTSLDLSKNITEISSVKNGTFDFISNQNATISYPLLPASWDYSNSDSLSGIIRVNSALFANDCVSYELTSSQNPGPNTTYSAYIENNYTPLASQTDENVLMIRSNDSTEKYFKSSSFSLSANTSTDSQQISKVEIAIKTLNSTKAYIKLVDSNHKELAVIDNISNSDWTNYTIFIKNGISSSSVNLYLGISGNGNNDYAFFDFAKFTDSVEISISEILALDNSAYVDLITDGFYSYKSSKNYGANQLVNWSNYEIDSTASSALYNGVVYTPNIFGLSAKNGSFDKNILVISNTVNSYQTIKSNYNFSITKGNYYEFSVYIKTDLDSSLNSDNYGASFELATVDSDTNSVSTSSENKNKFVNIISSSDDSNWEKYSIYIYAEEDQTIGILLGLGSEDDLTIGKVYFDDVTVKNITETEYKQQETSNNTIVSKVLTSTKDSSNSNSESTSYPATESNPINIFILFSSIILAVALVLAIAGYAIRRIPKRTIAKVEKSNYAVKPTKVNEKDIKHELKVTRENKISELTAEIELLKNQKESLQKEYEEKSNNEESLSIKENIYKTYTKRINKLTKKIDYMESAIAFSKDETNIKSMENTEIKKKQKESIQEFINLKNRKDDNEKQPIEEKAKRTKKKKLNPNKIKKD